MHSLRVAVWATCGMEASVAYIPLKMRTEEPLQSMETPIAPLINDFFVPAFHGIVVNDV